jgi:C_GCAxxG_C_C family probable redox protein
MKENPMKTKGGEGEGYLSTGTDRRQFVQRACPLVSAFAVANTLSAAEGRQQANASSILTTEDRLALALMRFKMGFHCSQSVLEAYAEDFGLEPELTRRLASAIAGGSTVGGECGAVASGYLVLGLKYGQTVPAHGNLEREKELWDRVKRFVSEFTKRHGAINCRELLGIDVSTEEGWKEGNQMNLFRTRCPNFIRDAITILDSLDRT